MNLIGNIGARKIKQALKIHICTDDFQRSSLTVLGVEGVGWGVKEGAGVVRKGVGVVKG